MANVRIRTPSMPSRMAGSESSNLLPMAAPFHSSGSPASDDTGGSVVGGGWAVDWSSNTHARPDRPSANSTVWREVPSEHIGPAGPAGPSSPGGGGVAAGSRE